ncbi:Protein of unknown function DUF58 [Nocardioides alpinus]|uniref:DUF58 domain-containing protein n=1 Tax=Nocardioides alpinus TaxID=748909 RepID=A0A1I1B526_9ACTN|nr:DUF58 domain-containing protein [Nocardioides alpinus]PKH41375.1 DUF58 domain-containing protein [Nocardioides alpinus]SFB45464.1 Protein of unknown function DUF58 [Nocardioides alpinus]
MSDQTFPSAAVRRVARLLSPALAPLRMLTPLGRSVLALGIATILLAVRLNWQEFTQLGVVALGLLTLGFVWQVLPGTPTSELVVRPSRLVEGVAPAVVALTVRAGAAPMLFPKVSVPVGGRTVSLRLPFLAPFSSHTESVQLPEMPRGVHAVGPATYEKTDPVGLVTRRFETGDVLELLVAPRVTDLSVFAGGLTNDLDGATSQQLSMSDLAFHALREYVPGDDLRHVHWRSSAKAGQLLVRQYHETRRGHVTVLVDGARSSYPRMRDFELAVSVATSIALRAVRDDFDTYLRCGPHVSRGRSAVAMTDIACRFVAAGDDYLAQAADAATAVSGTGLVVQVTGAARDLAELDAAAQRFDRGADWIVVRADSESEAQLHDSHSLRELSIPDLVRLQELLARGMR